MAIQLPSNRSGEIIAQAGQSIASNLIALREMKNRLEESQKQRDLEERLAGLSAQTQKDVAGIYRNPTEQQQIQTELAKEQLNEMRLQKDIQSLQIPEVDLSGVSDNFVQSPLGGLYKHKSISGAYRKQLEYGFKDIQSGKQPTSNFQRKIQSAAGDYINAVQSIVGKADEFYSIERPEYLTSSQKEKIAGNLMIYRDSLMNLKKNSKGKNIHNYIDIGLTKVNRAFSHIYPQMTEDGL